MYENKLMVRLRAVSNVLLISAFVFTSTVVFSNPSSKSIQVTRYMTVVAKPSLAQRDSLQQVFAITFPSEIKTIGSAVRYILAKTSYRLVGDKFQSREVKQLLCHKLPLADRRLGPTTVLLGLQALVGRYYQVIVDPQNRYVSFMLRPQFRQLYSS